MNKNIHKIDEITIKIFKELLDEQMKVIKTKESIRSIQRELVDRVCDGNTDRYTS